MLFAQHYGEIHYIAPCYGDVRTRHRPVRQSASAGGVEW
ncbi:hypothetical protein L841_0133 [Mycobacterium sp. MAC_080597_8934]|nr:hypothetical protein L841_0133 [Mycobacterium sp. MAC_080597_8934]